MRFGRVMDCGMLLLACMALEACAPVLDSRAWYLSDYKDSFPSLFQPEPISRQPDPEPAVKSLLAANMKALFGNTRVMNVGVGPPRPNGYGWAACVRAEVAGITGASLGTQFFLVEIDQGAVGLRRPADPTDRCETVRYETI